MEATGTRQIIEEMIASIEMNGGYLPAGVLSEFAERIGGQPEILQSIRDSGSGRSYEMLVLYFAALAAKQLGE